jgi:hypothetical protein
VVWCFSQSTECYKQWVSNLFWSRSILRSCKFFVTSFMESKNFFCKRLVFFFLFKILFVHSNQDTLYFIVLILYIWYGQEKVYQDNIVASVAVLKKLSDDWKVQATKLSPYEPLREILKHFRQKVVFSHLSASYILSVYCIWDHLPIILTWIDWIVFIEVAEFLNLVYDDLTVLAAEWEGIGNWDWCCSTCTLQGCR